MNCPCGQPEYVVGASAEAYVDEHQKRHTEWHANLASERGIPPSRAEYDRLRQAVLNSVPVVHIPLAPFDSPTSWRCCSEGTCDGKHDFVQRRSGSKDDRISAGKTYLARIHGRWFMGTFGEQWYGWNFNNWGMTGIQLDLIEDLYEIDLEAL